LYSGLKGICRKIPNNLYKNFILEEKSGLMQINKRNTKLISLRSLIIGLVCSAMIFTLCISMISGYLVSRGNAIEKNLEMNRIYSVMLAQTTDLMFKIMHQQLATKYEEVVAHMSDRFSLEHQLQLLLDSSESFNSVFVADAEGTTLATYPNIGIVGKKLTSPGIQQAMAEKRPLVSSPYIAATGRFIVLVSTPLWDKEGNYLGILGGTIYLQEENILQKILGEHYYQNGSYVYVVDKNGNLIYHPEKNRIGENESKNKVVQSLMNAETGFRRVINTKGVDMLAGYSYVPSSQWGIVSQTPTAVALAPALDMVLGIFLYSLSYVVIIYLGAWWMARKITKPLEHLAQHAEAILQNEKEPSVPNISTWYDEVNKLYKAILLSLHMLQQQVNRFENEAHTDPLTGLHNRRTISSVMEQWIKINKHFSLIMMDIDHFKKLNDNFGHQAGDEVLKFLAHMMKQTARRGDIYCRYGGEEFLILLPDTDLEKAFGVAERLRLMLSAAKSPTGESITLSLGVTHYPNSASDAEALIARADELLYQAKRNGRNQTIQG
jgi:diguanylate cyclase (GGDEF)-like protein